MKNRKPFFSDNLKTLASDLYYGHTEDVSTIQRVCIEEGFPDLANHFKLTHPPAEDVIVWLMLDRPDKLIQQEYIHVKIAYESKFKE